MEWEDESKSFDFSEVTLCGEPRREPGTLVFAVPRPPPVLSSQLLL